jgi:hypothetical protein
LWGSNAAPSRSKSRFFESPQFAFCTHTKSGRIQERSLGQLSYWWMEVCAEENRARNEYRSQGIIIWVHFYTKWTLKTEIEEHISRYLSGKITLWYDIGFSITSRTRGLPNRIESAKYRLCTEFYSSMRGLKQSSNKDKKQRQSVWKFAASLS